MNEITEKDINNFFISCYSNNYKDYSLIYDNMEKIRELTIITYKYIRENPINTSNNINWDGIEKSSIIEYLPLINDFYKKLNIDIDLNKLIEDGTITLNYRKREDFIKKMVKH